MQGLVDFEQFMNFLEVNKFPHSVNREQQLVEIPSKAAPLPGNLYVKWEPRLPFLQLIQFMINDVPEARIADLETAIVRINCALEIPGFGFDHRRRRLFCRLTVPVFAPEGITPTAFHRLGQACVGNAKELYPAFKAVVDGEPGAEIERIAMEKAKAARPADGGALA